MENIRAIVFDIKKFAIHDGPGIRTTVFLKGCPLKCVWCHNPESQGGMPEISFLDGKCIRCGYCVEICPGKCHSITEEGHFFERGVCQKCGKCAEECYSEALEVIGKNMSVREVMDEVMKDAPFYETSKGGLTVSGGEPMMQFDFTMALLREAKKNKLHTCLDTSGFAPFDKYEKILDLVDIFLYDLKETDSAKHEEFTGAPLEPILKNLKLLDQNGAKLILRCPVIPGFNDREEHLRQIGETAEALDNILEINVHPYHPLGKSKSSRIGKEYPLTELESFVEDEVIERWIEKIKTHTSVPVTRN